MEAESVIYGSKLIDREVKNMAGETLGRLEELVLDVEDGCLVYAVVRFGRGMAKAGKLFAVPWRAMQLAKDEATLLLDIEKASAENAPSFDKNSWPNMADRRWGRSIHTFFEQTPYWEERGHPRRVLEEPERQYATATP